MNVESVDRIIYSILQRFNLEWKTRTLSVFTLHKQLDHFTPNYLNSLAKRRIIAPATGINNSDNILVNGRRASKERQE
jgi:hypothetical protein